MKIGCKRQLNKLRYHGKTVAFYDDKPEVPYPCGGEAPWTLEPGFWSIQLLCGEGGWMCWECAVKIGLVW